MFKEEAYQYDEFSLLNIRNRNETRIIALIPDALAQFPKFKPEMLDIQDIYALTLNKLKPRYTQASTLVLNETVTDDLIMKKLKQAIRRVQRFPNHN